MYIGNSALFTYFFTAIKKSYWICEFETQESILYHRNVPVHFIRCRHHDRHLKQLLTDSSTVTMIPMPIPHLSNIATQHRHDNQYRNFVVLFWVKSRWCSKLMALNFTLSLIGCNALSCANIFNNVRIILVPFSPLKFRYVAQFDPTENIFFNKDVILNPKG